MRIWGGLKYEEIAEALAISTSSAHRQYERALAKLRTDIGDAMFDEHEPAEPEMTPDLKAIERQLARLTPRGAAASIGID